MDCSEKLGPTTSRLVDDAKKLDHEALIGTENETTTLSSSKVTVCCWLGVSVVVVVFSPLVVRLVRSGSVVACRRDALRLSDALLDLLVLPLRDVLEDRDEDRLELCDLELDCDELPELE
jgi:hypothetical protein